MKKLLLSILAIGTIVSANAQKGSILVYGNIGITSGTDDAKTKYSALQFNPGVGYQFDDMWTAGVTVRLNDSSITPDGGSKIKANSMGIGVFGRYSKPINNVFSFYAQLDVLSTSSKTDPSSDATSFSGMWIGVTPAISVHIPKWFEMNFSFGGLSYMTNKSKLSGANTASELNFNFGQTVNIGISKNFGTGKKMHGHHEPGEDTRHMNTKDDDDDAPRAKKEKKAKKSKKAAKHDKDDDE